MHKLPSEIGRPEPPSSLGKTKYEFWLPTKRAHFENTH